MQFLWVLLIVGLICNLATGASITVNTTLIDAITNSTNGDTIILGTGITYSGDGNVELDVYGRNLVFIGADSVIDCQNSTTSAFAIYYDTTSSLSNTSETTITFSGITFVNCGGGAIYINSTSSEGNCSVAVTNCTFNGNANAIYAEGLKTQLIINTSLFVNNSAIYGAALLVSDDAFVTVSESTFTNNSVSNQGGAIAIFDFAILVLSSSSLSLNSAEDGGALYFYRSFGSLISKSTISKNKAILRGGGLQNFDSYVQVVDSLFSENVAINGGGVSGYAMRSVTIVMASQFINNRATLGAGLCAGSASIIRVYSRSVVTQNTAVRGGGVAALTSSRMFVNESDVINNQADEGGAVYVNDYSYITATYSNLSYNNAQNSNSGNNVFCQNSDLIFTDTSVASDDNTLPTGVVCNAIPEYTWCRLKITNSGVWNNVCVEAPKKEGDAGLKGWKIALIVIGTLIGALLIGFLVAYAISTRFEAPSFFEKIKSAPVN